MTHIRGGLFTKSPNSVVPHSEARPFLSERGKNDDGQRGPY